MSPEPETHSSDANLSNDNKSSYLEIENESGSLDSVSVGKNYHNTKVDVIHVNKDKAINCINEFRNNFRTRDVLLGYFGIVLTALTTLVAAQFSNKLFSSTTWNCLYIILSSIFGYLFLAALVKFFATAHKASNEWLISILAGEVPKKHLFVRCYEYLKSRFRR